LIGGAGVSPAGAGGTPAPPAIPSSVGRRHSGPRSQDRFASIKAPFAPSKATVARSKATVARSKAMLARSKAALA